MSATTLKQFEIAFTHLLPKLVKLSPQDGQLYSPIHSVLVHEADEVLEGVSAARYLVSLVLQLGGVVTEQLLQGQYNLFSGRHFLQTHHQHLQLCVLKVMFILRLYRGKHGTLNDAQTLVIQVKNECALLY